MSSTTDGGATTDMIEQPQTCCNCKVGRVSATYDIDLCTELRSIYAETESLRQTARELNIALTAHAMERTDERIVGTAEMVYDALAGDGCDAKTEAEARDQLTYAGVDVAQLTDSFISHVGVKRHLNGCEDIDTTGRSATTDPDEFVEQLRGQEDRVRIYARQGVERFRNDQFVTLGDFEVRVKTTVRCTECDTAYSIRELFEQQSCECGDTNNVDYNQPRD